MATNTVELVETMPRDGLHRYLYEHMIARTLDLASKQAAQRGEAPLTVKHRNMLRDQIAQRIGFHGEQAGLNGGIDDPNMGYAPVVTSINEVVAQTYPNAPVPFDIPSGTKASDNPVVKRMFGDFMRMTRFGGKAADDFDARLPLSAHDPRWRDRASVMRAGLEQVAIPLEELQRTLRQNSLNGVENIRIPMKLVYAQPRGEQTSLREAGRSNTYADVSGFARLRPFMSSDEASRLEDWAHSPARQPDGKMDASVFMDQDAADRAVAVLEDLSSRGVGYSIERDKHPGQLKVRLDSGINMRIMDTANRQSYVANSIYHHDKKYSYSIDTNSNDTRMGRYTPTPQESVNLLRLAEGSLEIDGAYHTSNASVYPVGVVQNSIIPGQNGRDLRIRCGYRNELVQFFGDHDRAETAVRDWVDAAKTNLSEEVGAEGLIELADKQREALRLLKSQAQGEVVDEAKATAAREVLKEEPDFSMDSSVARVQEDYWAQLSETFPDMSDVPESADIPEPLRIRPRDLTLDERVPVSAEVTNENGETVTKVTRGYEKRNFTEEFGMYPAADDRSIVSVENAERAVRAHADSYVTQRLGDFEPDATNTRFDPVVVSRYADPGNIRETRSNLISALRQLPEIEYEQFMGDDFGNDRIVEELVRFNPNTAQSMSAHEHPQMRRFASTIQRALEANGCDLTEDENGNPNLLVDDQGVVRYEARRRNATDRAVVTGEIGQVLTQGEQGEIYTKFAHGNNHMFVPGYTATILPQKVGETKGIAERTKLRGFEQTVNDHLTQMISDQVNTSRDRMQAPAGLNRAYRELYGHKFPVDYLEQSAEEGLDKKWQNMILYTESRRVHYGKEIGDGASLRSEVMAKRRGFDPLNDNTRDPLVLTGGKDITTLDAEDYDGRFSSWATGTARNHGRVVYLVDSAQVGDDGMIIKGEPGDDIALGKDPALANSKFDPHSRQNMTLSAILQASSINENVTIAQINFKNWEHDDGMLVSKTYADENKIRAIDGQMRNLTRADKITDTHGNKGVINYVVDPGMSDEEAEQLGLVDEVKFFRANPHVDIAAVSPYSGMSRQNAGLAREMIDSNGKGAKDIIIDDKVIKGRAGTGMMIVTHMSADKKTNIYDAEAVREGKGRRISNQLGIGLQSLGCHKTLQHFFKNNDSNVGKARAFIEATGITTDDALRLGPTFTAEDAAKRKDVEPGNTELVKYTKRSSTIAKNARRDMRAEALKHLRDGDMMKLPFALKMQNGENTPKIGVDGNGNDVYGLPILPDKYRSGEELHDGTVSTHEYTDKYAEIHMAATEFEAAREQMVGISKSEEQRLHGIQESCVRRAQSNHDIVAGDIVDTKINGKHNIFKEALMSVRAENSATAVWSADPRLKINQVAMSSEMAKELAVYDNGNADCIHDNSVGHTMLWRDPVWTGNGVRYMEVVIDDTLTGVAVNPNIAVSFDGDFDGDAPGLASGLPKEVHEELLEKATVEANLLNEGASVSQPDGTQRHDLNFSTEMTMTVAAAMNPEYKERLDDIVNNLHEVRAEHATGEISRESMRETQKAAMEDIDTLYSEMSQNQIATVSVDYSSPEAASESLKACYQYTNPETGEVIEHGAKGGAGKHAEYDQRLGIERVGNKVIDHGHSLISKDEHEAEQKAMGIKTESVGDAGTKQHRAIALLRAQGLVNEAAHISYGATQSILQAKKDPVDAIYREEVVSTAVPNLWNGYRMTSSPNEQGRLVWDVEYDKQGQPVTATKEQWVDQYMDMYNSKAGMGVPMARGLVENVAEALSDENGKMYNLDREYWDNLPENKQPLLMDRVAFGGKQGFAELLNGANQNKSLFEGQLQDFATRRVKAEMSKVQAAQVETQAEIPAQAQHQQPAAQSNGFDVSRTAEEDRAMAAQEQEAFAADQDRYAEVEEYMADGNMEAAQAVASQMRDGSAEKIRQEKQRGRTQRVQRHATVANAAHNGMDEGMSF